MIVCSSYCLCNLFYIDNIFLDLIRDASKFGEFAAWEEQSGNSLLSVFVDLWDVIHMIDQGLQFLVHSHLIFKYCEEHLKDTCELEVGDSQVAENCGTSNTVLQMVEFIFYLFESLGQFSFGVS